jgi:cytochrome b6-f complex iron-sulfur subunit
MTEVATSSNTGNSEAPEVEEKMKINRREALNLAWLASLGFITFGLSGITVLFGYPRFREGEFGGIFTFGPVANLPLTGSSPENFPKVKVWLSNTDQGLKALYKVCPHLGCLYGWNDQEFKFICPCHGSQYEADGDYILGPAPRSLDFFVIRIEDEDGNVLAETPAEGGSVQVPNDPTAIVRIDTGDRIDGESHF